MINAIAVGLVALTGSFYPFFAPLIGAIGTFVTGSDTSANILFGKLQANVASQLGLTPDQSTWLVASNTTGATGGATTEATTETTGVTTGVRVVLAISGSRAHVR